ncbi:helix-turn-helix domain-containing protein [Aquisalibacillus elongatus]|uniref:Helix-turn-helix protein n=1 Tax=Aquisalibacillus elongatus TaxID=485577 RepID=A0A3N5B9K3_9BACI|nr:helix-turn-helix transcriptional regulator [Aquisalibacillus elongatus]RPF54047.1 helix-turn-helix protein [Aquisalibacillus elongatus]
MKLDGKLIKWHRTNQKLTQEQLAEGICSVTQLSKIENSQIHANVDVLTQIADRLQFPSHKFTKPVDEQLKALIEEWLSAIHEFDLPNVNRIYAELKHLEKEALHYDLEFLYDLAYFGYTLITKQLKEANQLNEKIMKYEAIFNEIHPYSYHKFIAKYLKDKSLYFDSLRHLEIAEGILQDEDDPELFILLAGVHSQLDHILSSNDYARSALRIFQDKLYYTRIIECEIILSSNFILVGEYQVAEEKLQRIIALIDEKFDQSMVSKIYFQMSAVYIMRGELDAAIQLAQETLAFDINQIELMHLRYVLAHSYYLKGDYHSCDKVIQQSTEIAEEFGLDYYLIKFKTLKLLIDEEYDRLIDYLRNRALPFLNATGQAFDLKFYYKLLGKLLYQLKRYKLAAEVLLEANQQGIVTK